MSRKLGEDVIQIVPYIGAAYNIGKDISHGEFINAFINAGIGMLFLFFPETIIPMVIYDITTNLLQSRNIRSAESENRQNKIENTINNAIQMRQTYINSYTIEMLYMWWGHVYLQVEDMIYNLSQQMENYKLSMLHNITYHGLKVLETDKTASQKNIDSVKDNFEMRIDIHIQNAMQNSIDMLTVSAKKHLKEKWGKKIIEKLKTYDQEVSKKLCAFISNNSKDIQRNTTDNWTSKIENHFNGSGLDTIFEEKEINENINQIIYNLVATQSEDKKSKILCQIEVFIGPITKEREIIDITEQSKITVSKNIAQLRTPQGRKGYCMLFEKDHYIKLEKNALLSKISFYEDFTWNFWIRHPLETSAANQQNDVTIIQLIEDQKQKLGFQFILRNGRIYFIINTLNKDNIPKHEYLVGGDIQDNKWHMITVSFDSKNESLYFYKDTFLQNDLDTKNIQKRTPNADLKIGFENNNDPEFFFKIEQFKVYKTFFEKEQIQFLYNQDIDDYLYDHWGEPLRYNTSYYLNNVPLEGHETIRWKPTGFNAEYIAKNKSKYEFKITANSKYYPNLYIGEKVIFYLPELDHQKIEMPNRALVKMKLENDTLESCIYNKDSYLLYENNTKNTHANLFQLHALQNEITRTSEAFNPYSIIITTTTDQDYNDGAYIDYYYENKYYYNIERGDFRVDRNALAKAGKSPFIQSMENEQDTYINRFCWTFVPKDQDNGWKEP